LLTRGNDVAEIGYRVAGFISERWPTSARNRWPAYIGICTPGECHLSLAPVRRRPDPAAQHRPRRALRRLQPRRPPGQCDRLPRRSDEADRRSPRGPAASGPAERRGAGPERRGPHGPSRRPPGVADRSFTARAEAGRVRLRRKPHGALAEAAVQLGFL
jgi:hypothetical protein